MKRVWVGVFVGTLGLGACATAPPVVESYPEAYARSVMVNDTMVHVFDFPAREESGLAPLVFVHGYSGTGFESSFIQHYLTDNRRLIAPDLPGQGYSAKPEVVYSYEYYLEFLEEFLRSMELTDYVLIGHSMGGMIASGHAATDPAGLNELILIAPYGLPGEAGPMLEFLANAGVLVDYGLALHNPAFLRSAVRTQVFHDPERIPPDFVDYLTNAVFFTDNAIPALASITRNALTHDLEAGVLESVQARTLLVWGTEDQVLDFEWSGEFSRLLPESTLEAIPESGHLPHVEQARVTAQAILRFLDSDSGNAAR